MNFFTKTEGDWDTGCWLWTAAKEKGNYPRFWQQRKNRLAHRWIYETLIGPITGGLALDHVCVNPSCVAPNHLEPVTKAENLRRKAFRRAEAAAGTNQDWGDNRSGNHAGLCSRAAHGRGYCSAGSSRGTSRKVD